MKVLALLLLFIAQLADACNSTEHAIVTLLNHGYALPTGETCPAAEWDTVVAEMYQAIGYNVTSPGGGTRNLRAQRILYPPFCDACCWWAPNQCQLLHPGMQQLE